MTVTNLFLYYFYGVSGFLGDKKADRTEILIKSGEKMLLILVISEHLFICLQYILKYSISHQPSWVKKERENLLGYYQMINIEKEKKHNLEISLAIEKNRKKALELEKEKNIQNETLNNYINAINEKQKEISQKQNKIKDFNEIIDLLKTSKNEETKMSKKERSKAKRALNKKKQKYKNLLESNQISNFNELKNSLFDKDKNIFLNMEKQDNININLKLDKSIIKGLKELSLSNEKIFLLNDNKENSIDLIKIYFLFLFKKTFDQIEEIILSKKMEFLLNNNNSAIVLCDSCSVNIGSFLCQNCSQILCVNCKKAHLTNDLWEEHIIINLNLAINKNFINSRNKYNQNEIINFIKGESFNFPTYTIQNLGYDDLYKLFDLLYYQYINLNGINVNKNSMSAKEFIQLKLEFFTKLEITPEKAIENELENLLNNITYNWTEIFYVNRICFKNFKYYGAKTTLDKVFIPLQILQTGNFDEKLRIVLNILDIFDNKLIFKSELEKYFAFTLYQNCTSDYSVEKLLDIAFPFDAKFIDFSKLYETIYSNPDLLKVFQCLLQCQE